MDVLTVLTGIEDILENGKEDARKFDAVEDEFLHQMRDIHRDSNVMDIRYEDGSVFRLTVEKIK